MKELAITALYVLDLLMAQLIQPYEPVGAAVAAFLGFAIFTAVIIPYLIKYTK
jgi:membrane protein YdbS with pleckstrin-like domain